MPAFPTYARVLLDGYAVQQASALKRTEMDAGPPKQRLERSRQMTERQVTVQLRSRDDYTAFMTWFRDTIHRGADWFDWPDPETLATAIRIGSPASWDYAVAARDDSGGQITSVTDAQILAAQQLLAREVGVFVEPAYAWKATPQILTAFVFFAVGISSPRPTGKKWGDNWGKLRAWGVQMGTRHAWRNTGNSTARVMSVMLGGIECRCLRAYFQGRVVRGGR